MSKKKYKLRKPKKNFYKEPYFDYYDYHRNMRYLADNNYKTKHTSFFPRDVQREYFNNQSTQDDVVEEDNTSNVFDEYGFRKYETSKNDDKEIQVKKRYGIFKLSFLNIFIFSCIIILILSCILSAYISWNCYSNDLRYVRMSKTFLAFVFPYLYIPYFIVIRVILKVPCF